MGGEFLRMPEDSMQIANSSRNDKTGGKEIHSMEVESFEGDESVEMSGEQMEFLHEPRPLAIDDSISEESFDSQATLRFHINLVKYLGCVQRDMKENLLINK
ncbi:hypothetical protein RDI58_026926 [Solanum bulbocastanum]|uniref:Uncharacterized protein n=1 Tax=Solanum bulbocastanum TaxID=147425 RepID=A0AAN8SUI3_SOLBU